MAAAKKKQAATVDAPVTPEEVVSEVSTPNEPWKWVEPSSVASERLLVLLRRRGLATPATKADSDDFISGLQHAVRAIRKSLELTGERDQQTAHAIKTMSNPSASENEILTDGDWAALVNALER